MDWNWMGFWASEGGHKESCLLAKKWGEESGTTMDWDWMFSEATCGEHEELCVLAREWGATK
jgi:hypothetical protein